ncbi:MAG: hypothetical protein KGL95_14415 [Patescibacteria group bacterium]|nr:hypothetical protein [Patescibacteria group bacterium]
MLPPSQFGGDHGQDWDDISNQDVFGNEARYDVIRGGIEDWKDASGFDTNTWLEGITDIRDYVISIDDDGRVTVSFTFDFDIGDGEYTGTRNVSYSY